MAALWLVDTSAWIFALGTRPFAPIKHRVDRLLSEGRVLITGVVELELLGGARTQNEFQDLKELLGGLGRINTREQDWALAAELAFQLRRAGHTLPFTDILIAHQAHRARAGIVHADHDFRVVCREFRIDQNDFSAAVADQG